MHQYFIPVFEAWRSRPNRGDASLFLHKGAIIAMTKAMAVDESRYQVRVNWWVELASVSIYKLLGFSTSFFLLPLRLSCF